jgi:hypothetical protein
VCARARTRAGGLCTCSPRPAAQLPATLIPAPPPPSTSLEPGAAAATTTTAAAAASRAAPDTGGRMNPITAAGGLNAAGTDSEAGPGSGGSDTGSGGLGAGGPGSAGSGAGAGGQWLKKMVSTDTCARERAWVYRRCK